MIIRNSVFAVAALVCVAAPAGAVQNLSKRAVVAADATVEVSNVEGRVDVTAWDRNEVELTARLESDEDTLEFEATDRQVRIKVVKPKGRFQGSDEAILTLKIPQGARLTAQTVSADVEVAGVRGEQRLNTVSGDVKTQAYDEPVVLRTVSGDGVIRGTGGKAAVSVTSVSGTVEAGGIRGGIDGQVVSGQLTVELAAAEKASLKSISGDIDARLELLPVSRVEVESVSGTIGLAMKKPVNAEFDVESFSGDITSCFDAKARDKSAYGPGSELRYTQGSGGARVRIKSMSGDISICDR
jgi:DUF4097 and DUF4098 domain-containing protein YvlB